MSVLRIERDSNMRQFTFINNNNNNIIGFVLSTAATLFDAVLAATAVAVAAATADVIVFTILLFCCYHHYKYWYVLYNVIHICIYIWYQRWIIVTACTKSFRRGENETEIEPHFSHILYSCNRHLFSEYKMYSFYSALTTHSTHIMNSNYFQSG